MAGEAGVDIQTGVRVTDVDFVAFQDQKRQLKGCATPQEREDGESSSAPRSRVHHDRVEGRRFTHRALNKAAALVTDKRDGGWSLWARMAAKVSGMGNPTRSAATSTRPNGPSSPSRRRGRCLPKRISKFRGSRCRTATHPVVHRLHWGWACMYRFNRTSETRPRTRRSCSDTGSAGNTPGNYVRKTMTESTGRSCSPNSSTTWGSWRTWTGSGKSRWPSHGASLCHQPVQPEEDHRPAPGRSPEGSTNLALWDSSSRSPTTACSCGLFDAVGADRRLSAVERQRSQSPRSIRASAIRFSGRTPCVPSCSSDTEPLGRRWTLKVSAGVCAIRQRGRRRSSRRSAGPSAPDPEPQFALPAQSSASAANRQAPLVADEAHDGSSPRRREPAPAPLRRGFALVRRP